MYFNHLIILFFLSLSSLVQADSSCVEMRLDDPGEAFSQIPVYDQIGFSGIDSEICYSIVAAQLIDAYRFSRKRVVPNQLSAPVSVAAIYKSSSRGALTIEPATEIDPASMLRNGVLYDSLLAVKRSNYKICDQAFLNAFDGLATLSEAERATSAASLIAHPNTFLTGIFAEIAKSERVSSLPRLWRGRSVVQSLSATGTNTCTYLGSIARFLAVDGSAILEGSFKALQESSPFRQLQTFLENLCQQNNFEVTLPFPEIVRRTDFGAGSRSQDLASHVKARLSRDNPQPIGISFCRNVLSRDRSYRIQDSATGFVADDCFAHGSVIIGQRYNQTSKSCQFLVRDSMGPSCNLTDGSPKFLWDCVNGSAWVDADNLMSATFDLNYFPD